MWLRHGIEEQVNRMSDLISRQAVIDLLKEMRKDGDMIPWEGKLVFERIRRIPAVDVPDRNVGKWIDDKCSECGYGVQSWNNTPFCPNCGADMKGEQKKMGNKLRRIFSPTPEEREENLRKYRNLFNDLKQKKGCSTCKHCVHVADYPDFVTAEECECKAELQCDTVLFTVKNCEKWEEDRQWGE